MALLDYVGTTVFNLLLMIGLIVISVDIQELKQMQNNIVGKPGQNILNELNSEPRRIAWVDGHGSEPLQTYMKHIADVFEMMGFKVVTGDQPDNLKWDVMWIHGYSLSKSQYKNHIRTASESQLVNHIPGSGYYTSKVHLAATDSLMGVPKAFKLPEQKNDFLNYAQEHPTFLWVQKSNAHRNIKISSLKEIDFDRSDSFIQQFIENPLLIDGRKFDIGVYTVITSIKPLKVYLYAGDALLRFCPVDYEEFDASIIDKYVVGDDYTPIWEMPSLQKYYVKEKMGMRHSLDTYLISKGKNPMQIWSQIGEIISQVFLKKQMDMLSHALHLNTSAQLFELSRFDFIVDENLAVYLMEANMSPNLSTGHFKQNRLMYEQVLFNVFSLVGIEKAITKSTEKRLRERTIIENPIISERDLQAYLKECWDGTCQKCNEMVICKLCGRCMPTNIMKMLLSTTGEFLNRKQMIMVQHTSEQLNTEEDYLHRIWLQAKCLHNPVWCH